MSTIKINAPDGKTLNVSIPDNYSPDQIHQTAQQALAHYQSGQTTNAPESIGSKIDKAAYSGVTGALDLVNAPFEAVGEALRMPIEGDSNFRPPTILQKLGIADKTAQPPQNPFALPNQILTGAAAAAGEIPNGIDAMKQAFKGGYSGDRGIPGAIADTALAVGLGKLAPEAANAPIKAVENIPGELKAISNGSGNFAKKAFSALMGPSEEAMTARLERPADLKNAIKTADLASERLPKTVKTISKQIKTLDNIANDTLSSSVFLNDGALTKDEVLNEVRLVRNSIGRIVGPDEERAAKLIDKVGKNLSMAKNTISQAELKSLITKLDDNTNWDNPDVSKSNELMMNLRTRLDDILKTKNEAYKEAMIPVSEKVGLFNELKRKFNIKAVPGKGYVPDNSTVSALEGVVKDKNIGTQRILEGVKKATGEDYQKMVNDHMLARQFEPGATNPNGHRRVGAGAVIGTAVGKMFGSPVTGSAAGAATGLYLDKQGGDLSGKILDLISKNGSSVGELIAQAKQDPQASQIVELLKEIARYQPAARPFLGSK